MIGNDHWTLSVDDLGMKAAGDALAKLVLTCRPPYAVAVQGKWGSGKTSLMRYAMARLGGAPLATTLETVAEPVRELPTDLGETWKSLVEDSTGFIEEAARSQLQVVPIWFNPWQHQSAEQPVVALLQELRQQFTFLLKVWGDFKKLSIVSVEAGLTLIGELTDALAMLQGAPKLGAGGVFQRLRDAGKAYERRYFEHRHDAQRLQLLFEEAVDRLLRPEKRDEAAENKDVAPRRLVIFIDDLDRCAEAQTVHLLEAIKLYLQTKNCVFVVGMDSAAARRAVAKVLGQDGETAHEYLEKLFQTSFPVPAPRKREELAERLLRYHGLPDVKGLAEQICELAEPNPRKLKSFVAGLAAGWSIFGGRDQRNLDLLLLIHYLYSYHPDVYRLLSYDPEQVAQLNFVLTKGLVQMEAGRPPEAYFFREAFLHTVEQAFGKGVEPDREGTDAVVKRLMQRLDRHKGDRRFVALWKKTLGEAPVDAVVERFRPFLELRAPEGEP